MFEAEQAQQHEQKQREGDEREKATMRQRGGIDRHVVPNEAPDETHRRFGMVG